MAALLDFFEGIGSVVVSLVDFLIQTIMDLVYIIGLLGSMIINLPEYFGWLPSAIVTSIITIFSIVVIYKILGREG